MFSRTHVGRQCTSTQPLKPNHFFKLSKLPSKGTTLTTRSWPSYYSCMQKPSGQRKTMSKPQVWAAMDLVRWICRCKISSPIAVQYTLPLGFNDCLSSRTVFRSEFTLVYMTRMSRLLCSSFPSSQYHCSNRIVLSPQIDRFPNSKIHITKHH